MPIIVYTVVSGQFPATTWQGWLAVVYMAIFTSVISYLIWFTVLRSAGSSLGAMSLFIQPVVGSLIGLLVLHEPSSPGLYIGATLIFGALALATIGQEH